MAKLSLSRTTRTILAVLPVQAGLIAEAGGFMRTTVELPATPWDRVFPLLAAGAMVLLGLATTVMLGVRWRRQEAHGLREARHHFRHLVDSIEGIVWETDASTLTNLFVSRQAERLLGYPVAEWYADPLFWRKHLHPEDRERTIALFEESETKLLPFTAEYRMICRDGAVVWIRDIVSVTAADGKAPVLHGVMVDITEKKRFQDELEAALQEIRTREADLTVYKDRLEELVMERSEALIKANRSLRKAWEKAEESSRMKSSFLANVSHELRTPLNAIILYSDLIMDEARALEQRGTVEDLGKIQSAGRHLLALIDDILDLSKIEAGRISLVIEDVDVPAMVQEIAANMAPMVGKNRNRLALAADPQVRGMHTDQTRLRQILINLLGNACKFTSEGTITLGFEACGGGAGLLFYVRDTGIGMTREQQERIFQPFSQADGSTTRRFGGTGLGLALSRRLAELLGGSLWAESEEGKGSTFYARLPVRVPGPEALEAAASGIHHGGAEPTEEDRQEENAKKGSFI